MSITFDKLQKSEVHVYYIHIVVNESSDARFSFIDDLTVSRKLSDTRRPGYVNAVARSH